MSNIIHLLEEGRAAQDLTNRLLTEILAVLKDSSGELSLKFIERKENTQLMADQTFQVHPDKLVDIVGSVPDGSTVIPVTLSGLTFLPLTSNIGFLDTGDAAEGPDNDVLNTKGVSVGATDTLNFTALGSDGKNYVATAVGTVIPPDQTPSPMNLVFTERP